MQSNNRIEPETRDRQDKTLLLPASGAPSKLTSLTTSGAVVIVGANGSGKTRLGAWFEWQSAEQRDRVHRVAAQKSLTFPESAPTASMASATNALLYGYAGAEATPQHRINVKRQGNAAITMQNDFQQLMSFLFTDDYEVSSNYRRQATQTSEAAPPSSRIDRVKAIWESVLPERELLLTAGSVAARSRKQDAESYKASELSDGERAVFYLAAQCLAAKPNGILVIDEPEIHLHRAILARLWLAIEKERSDCTFVYLTHDLDFAASRLDALKIWLRGFDGSAWEWDVIEREELIPEPLFLEILGSRKPVLFVEGDRGSVDHAIYSAVYSSHSVAPCGGAESVIHCTASFRALAKLHRLHCAGIIDRDTRNEDECANLKSAGVFCLDYSEAENIILDEAVLSVMAETLKYVEPTSIVVKARDVVLGRLRAESERVISAIVAGSIERLTKNLDAKARGRSALVDAVANLFTTIRVNELWDTTERNVENVIAKGDYRAALLLLNSKGLVNEISGLFGFQPKGLREYFLRLLQAGDANLISALKACTPRIS